MPAPAPTSINWNCRSWGKYSRTTRHRSRCQKNVAELSICPRRWASSSSVTPLLQIGQRNAPRVREDGKENYEIPQGHERQDEQTEEGCRGPTRDAGCGEDTDPDHDEGEEDPHAEQR